MKKFLLSILIAVVSMTVFPFSAEATEDCEYDTYRPFTDVDYFLSGYEKSVELLAQLGIVNGYEDGTFRPVNNINRAEMLKILAEGMTIYKGISNDVFEPYASENCFSDVPANEWFTKYVCYGKAQGWVAGYDNGKYFKPNNNVTFVEAMKLSLEAFGIEYEGGTDPWYRGVVDLASERHYIPCIWEFNDEIWREEMAAIIARIIKYDEEELVSFVGEDKILDNPTFETISNIDNVCFHLDLTEHEYCKEEPYIIEIKSTGFDPPVLEMPYGKTVKFVNETKDAHWPISPQVNFEKCGENNYFPFGSCEQLNQFEAYSFYVEYSGEYAYYDKLNPEWTGKITVTGDNPPPWESDGYTQESGLIPLN